MRGGKRKKKKHSSQVESYKKIDFAVLNTDQLKAATRAGINWTGIPKYL